MTMAINYSALTPEELLPFIEAEAPGAQQAAVDKLRGFINGDLVDEEEITISYDTGVEYGRRELASEILSTYGAFLDDLFQRFEGDDLETLSALMTALKKP